MKRVYITTVLTCVVMLAAFIGCLKLLNLSGGKENLKVGFIYDNDESTPYTYTSLWQKMLWKRNTVKALKS